MLWQENVKFPSRVTPLPPGYTIVQLDSGHYMWVHNDGKRERESCMHWDRWAVWRGVFEDFEKGGANE